ncbi:hypothetical protein [Chryseobacterium sp. SIMBA_028]|uniref:hypothetical protein n=1 Tax=Chryseobacterium sp. SIMBA_028 TaxID=3085771 RepID=UPI00397C8700
MFEKILKELKTKYANLGLSETILKVMAETLAKTVEKEEEVETAVAGVEGQMKIYQSFADQNRTLQTEISNLKKAGEVKTEEKKEEKKEGEEKKEASDVPEWAKAIIESNKTLSESLTAMKTKEAQQTTAQTLQAKFTELKIPQSFQKLIPMDKVFATPEEMEAFVNEQKANYDGIAQEFGNAALSQAPKPLFGESKKEGEVSPDVQAYLDSKKQVKANE